jgi:hypothetical protein
LLQIGTVRQGLIKDVGPVYRDKVKRRGSGVIWVA